jgi:hypothetical protein
MDNQRRLAHQHHNDRHNGYDKPARPINKPPAFKARVVLELDLDLAYELGCFILDNKAANPAVMAIGHQLTGE